MRWLCEMIRLIEIYVCAKCLINVILNKLSRIGAEETAWYEGRVVYAMGKLKIWSGSISFVSSREEEGLLWAGCFFFFCFQDENLVNPMPSNEALCTTLMPTVGSYSTRKSTEEGLSLSLSERSKDLKNKKRKRIREKRESYYIAFLPLFCMRQSLDIAASCYERVERRRHFALHFTLIFVVCKASSLL